MDGETNKTNSLKKSFVPTKKIGSWCISVNKIDSNTSKHKNLSKATTPPETTTIATTSTTAPTRNQFIPLDVNQQIKFTLGKNQYYFFKKNKLTELVQCDVFKYQPDKLLDNMKQQNNDQQQQQQQQTQHQDTCVVCLDKFQRNKNLIKLNCQHVFHGHCILRWIQTKKKCPLCQVKISTVIYGEEKPKQEETHDSITAITFTGMFSVPVYSMGFGF